MNPYTILAVDDDTELLETHAIRLETEGWEILTANTLLQANEILGETVPDLLILDRMFETEDRTEDSLSWLSTLRQHPNPQLQNVRVLMLTHRNEMDDEADELDAGANYHLNKPFSYRQLVSVVKSVLRDRDAKPLPENDFLQVGPLVINVEGNTVSCDGEAVIVAETEFRLLEFFARNPDQIFSKDEILAEVWGDEYLSTPTRLVENYIKILRKMARDVNPNHVIPVFTVHSRGYIHRPIAQLGRIQIDYRNCAVSFEDRLLDVTGDELLFMTAFAKRQGRPRLALDKSQLIREIWSDAVDITETDRLDLLFTQLRDKLKADAVPLPVVEFEETYRYRKSLA